MSYTPGPWEYGEYHGRGWFIKATGDSIPICGGGTITPQTQRNAQLIASAPTLLEVLHTLERAFVESYGNFRYAEYEHLVLAAIAKATKGA